MNVNIDSLDVGDIQTGTGASDNKVLLIYIQRSHHGISYNIFSHSVQQRSGAEPETTNVLV